MATIFESNAIEDEVELVQPRDSSFCPCQYGLPGRCEHCDSRLRQGIYTAKEKQ